MGCVHGHQLGLVAVWLQELQVHLAGASFLGMQAPCTDEGQDSGGAMKPAVWELCKFDIYSSASV
jgi:hypothetical protein